MTTAYFTGEFPQRIDGKGRMSIPADFRRVLEQGDPAWVRSRADTETGDPRQPPLPRLRLLFSPRLGTRLEVWTVAAFDVVAGQINAARPATREKVQEAQRLRRFYFGHSTEMEVDKDGRVVMPLDQRRNLGLAEGGEVIFAGMGDRFEIWAAGTYAATVAAEAAEAADFDPTSALWSL